MPQSSSDTVNSGSSASLESQIIESADCERGPVVVWSASLANEGGSISCRLGVFAPPTEGEEVFSAHIKADSSMTCRGSLNSSLESDVVSPAAKKTDASLSSTKVMPSAVVEQDEKEIGGKTVEQQQQGLSPINYDSKSSQHLRQLRNSITEDGVYSTSAVHAGRNSDCSCHSTARGLTHWNVDDCCPPYGVVSVIGRRREMEDAVAVVPRFLSLPCEFVGGCTAHVSRAPEASSGFHFFGVYDGHGGVQAAQFCRDHLHRALAEEIHVMTSAITPQSFSAVDSWQEQWEKAMNACFLRMDVEIGGGVYQKGEQSKREGILECCVEPIAPETVGSTAVVAVVGTSWIIVANCGDSRAVLSRRGHAIALSVDHKPDRADEMMRIEAAGGRVICWNGYRVFGVLAMSRAIGDRYLKPYIIANPEVTCTPRSEDDECLIIASDGLWDVLSNDEACEFARKRLGVNTAAAGSSAASSKTEQKAEAAAALLAKIALSKGSNDNISVVVVDLKNR